MSTDCHCDFAFEGRRMDGAPVHGMKGTKLYETWKGMKKRCFSGNADDEVRLYQDKGIGICTQWVDSFLVFFNDMGPKPAAHYSIDRIDGTKGYCPHNCRWATPTQQVDSANIRGDYYYVYVEFNGRKHLMGKVNGLEKCNKLISEMKLVKRKEYVK